MSEIIRSEIIKTAHINGARIEDVYTIITDLKSYPEFLPWVKSVRIEPAGSDMDRIEMTGGLGVFLGKLTSRARYESPKGVYVEQIEGPLDHFTILWGLKEEGEGVRVTFNFKYTISGHLKHLKDLSLHLSSHLVFKAYVKRIREKVIPEQS